MRKSATTRRPPRAGLRARYERNIEPARNALSRLEGTNWSCKSERNSSSSASLANDGASSARTHSEMSRAPSPAALRSAASDARAYPGSSTSRSSRTLVSIAVRTADLLQVAVHGPSLGQLAAAAPLGEGIGRYGLVSHQPAADGFEFHLGARPQPKLVADRLGDRHLPLLGDHRFHTAMVGIPTCEVKPMNLCSDRRMSGAMQHRRDRIEGGILGLLVGDALGVPYEFHVPGEIPGSDEIEMCGRDNRPPRRRQRHSGLMARSASGMDIARPLIQRLLGYAKVRGGATRRPGRRHPRSSEASARLRRATPD